VPACFQAVTAGMNLVYGGGHVGLMGTVADAAVAAGAHVTGVIPRALQAREAVNHNIAELVIVDTMHVMPARPIAMPTARAAST
jgi:predicted Rossmann-fold nucleotide-binding protein